jgi:hypothetical protein
MAKKDGNTIFNITEIFGISEYFIPILDIGKDGPHIRL